MNENQATNKISKILLAVDSSEHSLATVDPVIALATATGAEIQVLHVWNLEIHTANGVWDVETRSEARALVDSAAARIAERGLTVTTRLESAEKDRIPATIVAVAGEFGADLIAVGSRGIDDFSALLFGSVSQRVLHDSDCQVLVIRAAKPAQVRPEMRRLLVAVAGKDDAEPATEAALAVARSAGAEVLVVHARYLTAGEGFALIETGEEAAEIVSGVVTRLRAAGIRAEARITGPSTNAATDITAAARSWNADMIVMGSRRPSGLGALFGGSVNHKVIHDADRPVMVAGRQGSNNHR